MNNLPMLSDDDPPDGQAVALFFATETYPLDALRNIFESSGIKTIINESGIHSPEYTVICGTPEYVKSFLAKQHMIQEKTLCIVWAETRGDTEVSFPSPAKTVYLIPRPIDPQTANDILAFFFTGQERTFDLSGGNLPMAGPQTESGSERDSAENDNAGDETSSDVNPDILRLEDNLPASAPEPTVDKPEPLVIRHVPQSVSEAYRESERRTLAWPTRDTASDENRISGLISDMFGTMKTADSRKSGGQSAFNRWFRLRTLLGLILALTAAEVFIAIMGIFGTYQAAVFLKNADPDKSEIAVRVSGYTIGHTKAVVDVLSAPALALGSRSAADMRTVMDALLRVHHAERTALQSLVSARSVLPEVIGTVSGGVQSSTNIEPQLMSLRSDAVSINSDLGISLSALTRMMEKPGLLVRLPPAELLVRKSIVLLEANMHQARAAEEGLTLYLISGGFDRKRTFLLLLQNSLELRPTGGFIGSIGVVSLTHGKIENLAIHDVYTYDGQLKGHVDPPEQIRSLIKQEHWYLRDSNWDPDFRASAQSAAWFFQKEGGGEIDGVIAINLPVLVDMLRVTGPIDLPDYNDRITAENIYGKSLHYVQSGFFPGSSQKRDFLGSLFTAIIQKITGEGENWPHQVMTVVSTALDRRNIMVYFPDNQLQASADRLDWTGAYPRYTSCQDLCLSDLLGIVESNMAVSKVNYFVKRTYTVNTIIDATGNASMVSDIRFTNEAGTEAGSGGGYRNYLRFYFPADATLLTAQLNRLPVVDRKPESQAAPELPYAERITGPEGTQILGIAFDVAPQAELLLTLGYKKQGPALTQSDTSYVFTIPKQPGLEDTPVSGTVQLPTGWEFVDAVTTNGRVSLEKAGQLSYNSTLWSDVIVRGTIRRVR